MLSQQRRALTSTGESDSVNGQPTVEYVPRSGCSTSTIIPSARSPSSSMRSLVLSTGPQGTLIALSSLNASHFVRWIVHSSITSKMSCRCGSRALGVA